MELRIIKSRRTLQKTSLGPRFTTDCQPPDPAVLGLLLTVTGRKKPSAWGSAHCRIAKNAPKVSTSVQSLLQTASDRTTVFSLLLTVTWRKKPSPWGSAHCRIAENAPKVLTVSRVYYRLLAAEQSPSQSTQCRIMRTVPEVFTVTHI